MTAPDPIDLANALTARLCHDLAGSLGALTGLLELDQETPDRDALALALSCARDMAARLRLLRAAWGPATEPLDLPLLLQNLPNADRLTIETHGLPQALTPPQQQLALSLALAAAAALPRGGALRLHCAPTRLSLALAGPRVSWPQPGLGPQTMALNMARLQAEQLSWHVGVSENAIVAER